MITLTYFQLHETIYFQVFSKSMIFQNDHELKSNKGSTNTLDDYETKSEPDYLSDKPTRTKVYFEDEINSPVTDFEIMFKDELTNGNNMFKIEEEDETDKRSDENEGGLVMNVAVKKQDVIKPSTITKKDESKITTFNAVYEYDPTTAVPTLKTALSLPRVESIKGILRQNKELPRSSSARVLTRENSVSKLGKSLNRVESLKNEESNTIDRVLARVPNRSASFLNIPEHLMPEKPPLTKSKSTIGVASLEETDSKLSKLPDTPIIKSVNLPRFFADSPTIAEYSKRDTLQSIRQKDIMTFNENDFSMPRYYGRVPSPIDSTPVHESKSMPDLRNPSSSSGKVSKRLVKIRSKLKPLVIKKGTDEKL